MIVTETNNGILIGNFLNSYKAEEILQQTRQLIENYAYVSLADILDLCGETPAYKQTKIGWTADAMKDAKIESYMHVSYVIHMPEYDWYDRDNSDVPDEKSQSEPINLTIHNKDNIECVLKDFFSNAEAFKDRPIFITIM